MVEGVVVEVRHEKEVRYDLRALGEICEHVVQRAQDRQLRKQWQTAEEHSVRIDAVLLHQLHALRIEALRVLFELLDSSAICGASFRCSDIVLRWLTSWNCWSGARISRMMIVRIMIATPYGPMTSKKGMLTTCE